MEFESNSLQMHVGVFCVRQLTKITSIFTYKMIMFSKVLFTVYVYWATVCKTVRPMLSDRCLSVTLVYCGQTV